MNIFAAGYLESSFSAEVLRKLQDQGAVIRALANYRLMPKEYRESAVFEINALLLHQHETVAKAFPGISPQVLSKKILDDFREAERDYLYVVDRCSYFTKCVHEHKLVYRELVRYFIGFFESIPDIDLVIFTATPHFPWDVVLYHVARYMGIKTRFPRRTHLANKMLIDDSFGEPFKITPRHDLFGDALYEAVGVELLAIVDRETPWLSYSKNRHKKFVKHAASPRHQIAYFFRVLLAYTLRAPLRKGFFSPFAGNALKFPHWALFFEEVRQYNRAKDLADCWERLAKPADFTRPYIYLALHSQPERSTQPEAGCLEDQYLAAEMLAKSLPEGWELYIKEHPNHYKIVPPDLRQSHARSRWMYEQFAGLPACRLVPWKTSGDELIANARMSATITGSVGWQSLLAGKPAIVFGPAWYACCNSCFYVTSDAEVKNAIVSAESQGAEDVRTHLLQFIAAASKYFVESTSDFVIDTQDDSFGRYANNLASALLKGRP